MKNIDVKSLLIGALFTSTIFLGIAATGPTDKWDERQQWEYRTSDSAFTKNTGMVGFEPFAWGPTEKVLWRKRIKNY